MAAPPKLKPGSRTLLRRTELPGVFLNGEGAQVDERGVLLSLSSVKTIERQLDVDVLGEPVTSPAMLLKRVAMDPSLPLSMRVSAAVSAAPYFDRKMPLALEGGAADRPLRLEETKSTLLRNLSALPPDERKAALTLLERLGAMGQEP
jgi:hypothetical protein